MVKQLSVFFPAYNEQENIEKTIRDAIKVLKSLDLENFELIVVNDGSKDSTAELVEKLAKEDKRIRLVNHEKNRGYGEALKTGFKSAKYEWVVFTDSDGQFDFSEIKKLIERSDQVDFVLGYRLKRADPWMRILFGNLWNITAKILLGLPSRDYSCGFKLIKKSSFNATLPLEAGEKVTQIEMLVKAKRTGSKFVEVGLHHYPRKFGSQTGANLSVVAKSYLDLFKLWWKLLDKKQFLIILAILAVAAFLRFYRISEYMTFLGDEGRDALVIKDLLVNHHLPFIGPPTSIGNIYLGPLYYYMMALPMSIWWLNPVSAACLDALLGVLTVWLIYLLTKRWFGFYPAVIAAWLYTISPVTIIYSRSSWNPNPAPFFALLTILGLYKLNQSGNFRWLILSGGALAFAAQMHYLALILIPIVIVLWVHEILYRRYQKKEIQNLVSGTLLGLVIFLILMSPLVIFDLRHNFMNFKAISLFFSNRETTVNVNPFNSLDRALPIYMHNLVGRYVSGDMLWSNWLVSILVLIPLLVGVYKRFKKQIVVWPLLALGIWLMMGILGLALYKQTIYDHYLGFLNPVPYILLGSLVGLSLNFKIISSKLWGVGIIGLVATLTVVNLLNSPLKTPPNNQLKRTQEVAKYVIDKSENKSFNFALIAKNNYDSAYQFYLDLYGHKPEKVPFVITDQLIVVCEDSGCQPINNPKQEISHFGWSKIDSMQEFDGVKVYKLLHNPSGKP